MKQVTRIFGFVLFAFFVYFAQASVVQSADTPPPAPEFKAAEGKVLFYSEPHDEGKVLVGDKKLDFNSLSFPDKNAIVAKDDMVTLETDGAKVKKGTLKKK